MGRQWKILLYQYKFFSASVYTDDISAASAVASGVLSSGVSVDSLVTQVSDMEQSLSVVKEQVSNSSVIEQQIQDDCKLKPF